MKNKSLYRGLSYFFSQRIHRTNQNNLLEFVRLDSEFERSNGMLENTLRWEDDGGQMIGYGNPVDRLILYIAQELANERSMSEEKETGYTRIPFADNSLLDRNSRNWCPACMQSLPLSVLGRSTSVRIIQGISWQV